MKTFKAISKRISNKLKSARNYALKWELSVEIFITIGEGGGHGQRGVSTARRQNGWVLLGPSTIQGTRHTHTGTARRQMAAGNQLGSSQMTRQQADEEAGGGGGYYIGSSWHIVIVFFGPELFQKI